MSAQATPQLRKFEWSDLAAFRQLLDDVGRHGHRDWPGSIEDLRTELEYPRVRPVQNIVLARDDSGLIGYAIVEPEKNIGRSVIGIGSTRTGLAIRKQLLDWATNRASEVTPVAHLSTRDHETELEKLVSQMGWLKVRQYLKLDITTNLESIASTVPDGFTLRTMLGLDEVPELTILQNSAFEDHFGYSPNTDDEIVARLLSSNSSIDNILMIHDSEGQLVAYCWTQVQVREGIQVGRMGMTGVSPSSRGRGLGRAIAVAGFNHLVRQGVKKIELDVDATNKPALKIYTSLGFTTSSQVNWWERSL